MATERGYESQIAQAAPPAPVEVSPDAMGAGIGRVLEQIGAQAHQNEVRAYQVQRQLQAQQQHTQWAVQFADWTGTVAARRIELEAKPKPGAADHTAAMQTVLEEGDGLLAGITDPETRQAAQVQLAQYRAQQIARAEEFQTVQGLKDSHAAYVDTIGALRNRLSNSDGGEEAYAEASQQAGFLIGGMPVGEAQRAQMMREAGAELFLGRAAALADRDPTALREQLNTGKWDAVLSPQQMAAARQLQTVGEQRILAEQRAEQAATVAAQNEAKRQVLDRYGAYKALIEAHEPVASKDLAQLLADAKAAGVGAEDLTKIGLLGEDAGARRAMAGQPTRQLEDQYRGLTTRRDAGQLTEGTDLRQLDRLEAELKARAEHQGDSLSQLWKQGPAGQVEALQQLSALPVEQRTRVAAAMGEDKLAVVAALPGRFQQTALEGARRRAADQGAAFLPQTDKQKLDEPTLRQAFKDAVGGAIYNQLGGAENLYQAALDYYVGSQARAGQQGGWNKGVFGKAVKVMFGATTRPDGSWQGGLGLVRGRQVELPPRWNETEFDQRLSRYDFAAQGARYANGQPAQKADVLANYQLLFDHAAPDGTHFYRLVDKNGRALVRDTGHPFWLPVPASAR